MDKHRGTATSDWSRSSTAAGSSPSTSPSTSSPSTSSPSTSSPSTSSPGASSTAPLKSSPERNPPSLAPPTLVQKAKVKLKHYGSISPMNLNAHRTLKDKRDETRVDKRWEKLGFQPKGLDRVLPRPRSPATYRYLAENYEESEVEELLEKNRLAQGQVKNGSCDKGGGARRVKSGSEEPSKLMTTIVSAMEKCGIYPSENEDKYSNTATPSATIYPYPT